MTKVDREFGDIKAAKGFRDILIPIIWFSDDVEKISDEMAQKIKERL